MSVNKILPVVRLACTSASIGELCVAGHGTERRTGSQFAEVSVGRFTTEAEIEFAIRVIKSAVGAVRAIG